MRRGEGGMSPKPKCGYRRCEAKIIANKIIKDTTGLMWQCTNVICSSRKKVLEEWALKEVGQGHSGTKANRDKNPTQQEV